MMLMNSARKAIRSDVHKEGVINTAVATVSLILFVVYTIYPSMPLLVMSSLAGLTYGVLASARSKINDRFILFGILLFQGSILNIVFSNNGIGGSLVLLGTLNLAIFCIRNPRIVYYYSIIILLYYCYVIFMGIVVEGNDPYFFFEYQGKSRNYIGYLLITSAAFYFYLSVLIGEKPNILLLTFVVFLSFMAQGRTSLGVSIMLFIGAFFTDMRGIRWYLVAIIIAVAIGLLVYFWDLIVLWYETSNFASKQLESSRYTLWQKYFESLSLSDILMGKDLNTIPLIKEYDGNVHNSFLKFHARTGLLGFLPLLILILRSLSVTLKKRAALLIPVLAILIRIFFDADMLIGELDFVLYTMLWIPVLGLLDMPKVSHLGTT